jgi:nickel-dependent lactate racemase
MSDLDLDSLEIEAQKEKEKEEQEKGKKEKKKDEKVEVKKEDTTKKKRVYEVNGYKIDENAPKGSALNPYTFEEKPDSIVARCGNCSTTHGGQVYITWEQAIKMNEDMDPTVLKCPHCENTLGDKPFSKHGLVNPNFNPKNVKNSKK